MIENPLKKTTSLESVLIITVIVLLMIFSILLIRNIQLARKAGMFTSHISPISETLLKNKEMNQTSLRDVEYIDVWMTFQYVNFIFNIPENYLKEALRIEDVHYPNLPIGRYIKSKKLDKTAFISKIKEVVRGYMSLHPNK